MGNLKELIYLYAFLMLLNTIISILLYRSYKVDLYKMSSILWFTYFVNFLTQAMLDSSHYLMVIGYSTYFAVSIVFRRILDVALDTSELDDRIYYYVFVVCFGAFNLLYFFDYSFTVYSLPMAFAVTAPVLSAALKVLGDNKKVSLSTKLLCYFVILNSLHHIDYPFLRLSDFAPMGFTIAFVLIFTLSCILPAFVMNIASDKYIRSLESKLESKDTEVRQAKQFFEVVDQRFISKLGGVKDDATRESMLLSSLSHDINGSLQVMLLSSSKAKKILKDSEHSSKLIELMDKVEKGIYKISEMLDAVTKDQAKPLENVQMATSSINFEKLVEEIEKIFLQSLNKKQVSIKYISEVPSLNFYGDSKVLVNNILGNVLSNAIKFSHPGSIIKFELLEDKGEYIFIISDKGVGIAQEELKDIFELGEVKVAQETGRGIGLALVKKYLDMCNGEVLIRSIKGAGTIVSVKLKKSKNNG